MSGAPASFDDLLFDAVTLAPFISLGSVGAGGADTLSSGEQQLEFLTVHGQVKTCSNIEVRPLTPAEAQERLESLWAQPQMREQWLRELGHGAAEDPLLQQIAPLLGATDAGQFTQALTQWAGTEQPEALEQHLQALSAHLTEALVRLRAGEVPHLPPAVQQLSGGAPPVSPLLLGFLALAQAAPLPSPVGPEAEQKVAPAVSGPATPRVTLPAMQLDFSTTNLERVLGRKGPGES